MIVSGREICATQLVTHINQCFLSITNSLRPLSKLDYDQTSLVSRNVMKYALNEEALNEEALKFKKASGPDNIPGWILKDFAVELSTPVAKVFNASIQERLVPDV